MPDWLQDLCIELQAQAEQKEEINRLLIQDAIVKDGHLRTRHEQLDVKVQLLELYKHKNGVLTLGMVEMCDEN